MTLEQAAPIGIAGVCVEVGDRALTSEEFSQLSGLPREVIEEKLGFTSLRRWSGVRDEQAVLVDASVQAMAGLDPRRLDLIVCLLHPFHLEADVYGLGVVVKDRLGAVNAEVVEVLDTCAAVTLALQMCRELFLSEARLQHALIVGQVNLWNLLDYGHPATRWASAISDGCGAMLVSRNPELDNVLLETSHFCNPEFIDDVVISSPNLTEPITYKKRFRRLAPQRLDMADPEGFKARLDPVSQAGYVRAVRESLRASGFEDRDLDLLGANTMKPSMWARILHALDLDPATQIYDEENAHVAFIDQFLRILQVREERRLPQGGVLVLTTGGVGFHWTATTVAFKGPRLEGRFTSTRE
jgi:3-oxoacyl-[acyl-carrier-protein] synthase III